MEIIKFIREQVAMTERPAFKAGDNVSVHYKIIEGGKERIQVFRGDVIQIKGTPKTHTCTFTVRKISGGIGVERIFPLYSPNIDKIEVNKVGKVRRARLYYLRAAKGKAARIKEKKFFSKTS
ncbi:MAG: 50S ribosomal protein L19 [Chitinophagales bacterium]|nr:50S ribosomal protein L19 [Bacteroidota bacterium]MCB9043019.1 50S ribosomal protein L19 [Chitinophagales bacterium]